jgi:TolB protein
MVPDGTLIAYQSDGGAYPEKQGIYVMGADGSHVRRITAVPVGLDSDRTPRFAPDGRRLVFTRYAGDQGSALVTTDLRGHTTEITSFAIRAGDAVWSPHGKRIVFEAGGTEPESRGDVYIVNSNGTHLSNLTRNALGDEGSADPVWSPDGRKILFLQGQHLQQQDAAVLGLAVMRSDGSQRHFIEDHPIESHQPDWVRPTPSR